MRDPRLLQTLASEEALAKRVAYEREQRGWSYEALAKRMTAAACPINQSSIYKIEKGQPRRRVTVDELLGFSTVLGLDVAELLLPPEAILNRRLADLLGNVVSNLEVLDDYDKAMNSEWQELRTHLDRPGARAIVEDRFRRIEREDVRATALEALAKSDSHVFFDVRLSLRAGDEATAEVDKRGQRRKKT